MKTLLDPIYETIDGLLAWLGGSLGQLSETYCRLETANDKYTLVGRDGSLASVIRVFGATYLVGPDEFNRIVNTVNTSLRANLASSGHAVQVFFRHDKDGVKRDLDLMLTPAKQTAERLRMDLDDLFNERINFLSNYCAAEATYFVIWTLPNVMSEQQLKQATKSKIEEEKQANIPPVRNAQTVTVGYPEMRESHDSFVTTFVTDLNELGLFSRLLDVHSACFEIRKSIDPDFTDNDWQPFLPGDKVPLRLSKYFEGDISNILWPPLSKQLIPRDGENIDLRTARVGDKIYASVFIDLFPKELQSFMVLFKRVLNLKLPWRISYLMESNGMSTLGLKPTITSLLSFASNNNKLINSSVEYLNFLNDNTDESLVKLRVCAATWAPAEELGLLRKRASELAKAIQGWGYCETSEISGDPYGGVMSSALGINLDSHAKASIAPLSEVIHMLPVTRPASPWTEGAVLFRSPDGKPWPYQPGSTLQTTWIDIVYARPGSGKSVLSNSINLALCLSGGLTRLPRIAIIDIGPSSSGLISLLKSALPEDRQHEVAYHRLRMVKEMSINPFDTQLGNRFPSPQDRAFLVNFLTLLATPVGESKSYDGISDMTGMIVDELYKNLADNANPHRYTQNLEPEVDAKLKEINFEIDAHTSWWEVTDALFKNGFAHLATYAQRYAMPLLADAASICRSQAVEDLYGTIQAPTGETLINAFGRMISAAVREYPILSNVTSFDLGDTKVVSLDLDEVAKTGGEAADRQTAIMYMLARYILARHYYLTEDNVGDMPELYHEYHMQRVKEIREDHKRIVFDEFHRTSNAKAVRDQVLVDMREGRKWKVQVALLSQSLDDFDPVMIEFSTAIFIMDAGPKQAIDKSAKVFGLSDTAKLALENRVHGPKAGGATFLAQFATKSGMSTHLITSTIGPIELWAFNTTAEDARIRNALYKIVGAKNARLFLAKKFPTGSAAKVIEERLNKIQKDSDEMLDERASNNIIDKMIDELMEDYKKDPDFTL